MGETMTAATGPGPAAAHAGGGTTSRKARMPWWDVMLPCEGPGGGRWSQLTKWVQAPTAAQACEIAITLLPRGYSIDDSPSATMLPCNPHGIAAHEARLLEAMERHRVYAMRAENEPDTQNDCKWLRDHFAKQIPHLVKALSTKIAADVRFMRDVKARRWERRHAVPKHRRVAPAAHRQPVAEWAGRDAH